MAGRVIDYASLKADVLATLEREEDAEAAGLFDGWVSLCEGDFSPSLKAPWVIRTAQFMWGDEGPIPTDGSLRFEYLPPSFSGINTLLDLSNGLTLDPITLQELPDWIRAGPGLKKAYFIEGLQLFVLPDPGLPGIPLFMSYYSRQEPLTSDNPVNAVITQAPAIYKYGVLAHAAIHYGETENYATWSGLMAQAIEQNNELGASWVRGAGARVRVNR